MSSFIPTSQQRLQNHSHGMPHDKLLLVYSHPACLSDIARIVYAHQQSTQIPFVPDCNMVSIREQRHLEDDVKSHTCQSVRAATGAPVPGRLQTCKSTPATATQPFRASGLQHELILQRACAHTSAELNCRTLPSLQRKVGTHGTTCTPAAEQHPH